MLTDALPPLPEIHLLDQDLFLALFHPGGNPPTGEGWGSVDRLAIVGRQLINLELASNAFRRTDPPLTGGGIEGIVDSYIQFLQIEHWLDAYNLKNRLILSENESERNNQLQKCFDAYVGAVWYLYDRTGRERKAQRWVFHLLSGEPYIKTEDEMVIDPAFPPGHHASTSQAGNPPQYTPPQPSHPPPPMPPAAGVASFLSVASFNEMAIKRYPGQTPRYDCVPAGDPHIPIWTATCFVNNEKCGTGQGTNKTKAKEAAARAAFVFLGWGSN